MNKGKPKPLKNKTAPVDENGVPVKRICTSCIEIKEYIDERLNAQTAKFDQQNIKIMQALATINIYTKSIAEKESLSASLGRQFPISSFDNLENINEKITHNTKEAYVAEIKSLLGKNLSKNLNMVLTDELIYECNVDGTHNKKSLKLLKNFYGVLKDAVKLMPNISDVDSEIRKAIHLNKKRTLKKKTKERKANSQQSESESE